jgi:hypothetical protein
MEWAKIAAMTEAVGAFIMVIEGKGITLPINLWPLWQAIPSVVDYDGLAERGHRGARWEKAPVWLVSPVPGKFPCPKVTFAINYFFTLDC